MKQVRMQIYADRQTDAAQLHKNKKQGWGKYGCWINIQL